MGKGISISIEGQTLDLLPERGVYWREAKTLLLTDLHWGKSETFRLHGIPIPDGLMDEELSRLERVARQTEADRMIILGDLVHSSVGITEVVREKVSRWRATFAGQFWVVRGNHDRGWRKLPSDWKIEWLTGWKEGPFVFSHHPSANEEGFTWSGHLHPTFRMATASDSLRLPCFHLSAKVGTLPAFNFFTRGVEMAKRPQDRVFVCTERQVFEI